MKKGISNKIKNRSILLVFLAIISIVLLSILPLIKINDHNEKHDLYLNLNSMKNSQIKDIDSIIEKIKNIDKFLWTTIILSLFSMLGIVINLYDKKKNVLYFSKVLVMFGFPILFLTILIFFSYYSFITQVIESNNLQLAYLINSNFKYSHIILISSFSILVVSIFYFINLIKFVLYKDKINNMKQEQNKKALISTKKIESIKNNRKEETLKWLSNEVEKLDSPNDKIKEENEIQKLYSKEKQSREVEKTEEYKIRCPQCRHLFSINKIENVKTIKCPKCGKEGVLED